ncbi:hypothetical protein EVB99_033 [Rhizobium phage RHph_N3_19]|nr:hypothetical protein EVB99_033 [Rhizobium phage RHph_N3_19]
MTSKFADDWKLAFEMEMKVAFRIACPEIGYPESEAQYPTVEAWERNYKKDWNKFLARMM